jgi:hypothetical protein
MTIKKKRMWSPVRVHFNPLIWELGYTVWGVGIIDPKVPNPEETTLRVGQIFEVGPFTVFLGEPRP